MLTQSRMTSLMHFLAACLLAGFLAACGGGGTNDGCLNVDSTRSSSLPSCGGTSAGPGTGTSTTASMTISLQDANGAAITNLMPDSPGILKVTVKAANATV